MDPLQKLAELGFTNAEAAGTSRGLPAYRVRTSKGWVYHRFSSVADVAEWSKYHRPETSE